MRIGSLFAGIGGFDLAARWMGWETAWFSEIDPYASAVLAKHWPGVPNHGDITQIDFASVEPVDLLCGGFPCQDISNAGKREGIGGKRSGLWSEYARAIGELRPRYVVVENVAALLGRGLERVLGDLAALGYDAEWQVLSAADVGAPHLRERVWIVAYSEGERYSPWASVSGCRGGSQRGAAEPERRSEAMANAEEQPQRAGLRPNPAAGFGRGRFGNGGRSVAHPGSAGLSGAEQEILCGTRRRHEGRAAPEFGRWAVEPDVGRVAHGIPARVDRLTCLGNSLVPSCALVIFQTIQAREGAE